MDLVIHLCAFKNPRDLRQISTLGAKMIPGKGKFIVEAFQRATKWTAIGFLCAFLF